MDPDAVPGVWPGGADRHHKEGATEVVRDGRSWTIGGAADVAWIADATTPGTTIATAVPQLFDAYATIGLPDGGEGQERHDAALLEVLRAYGSHEWWLGYLDTGADDIVFPEAAMVTLYADWPYVLVQAGPDEAARWRRWDDGSFWMGHLPNLIFPADRSWLVSTLWDDEWTSVGGPSPLIEGLVRHPQLRSRVRRVQPDVRGREPRC